MSIEINEVYCICDIETHTIEEFPNSDKDELRYVGFKSKDKYICYHFSDRETIQKCISYFPYIVGHNFKKYDKLILERYGFKFRRDQVIIDTFEIVDNRFKSMLYIDLNSGDRSLDSLADRLNFECKKTKFDYSLLEQEILTGENYAWLEEYLFNDLNVTDELFKHCYNLFYGFRNYMSEENQAKMCWLINKPGSTAYKCICNLAGLKEEYSDEVSEDNLYEGGFVSEPYVDFVEG